MDKLKNNQKGFITLAFGEVYRKLAYNLLLSYRYNNIPYPFAVITDVIDRYTEVFDNVILHENKHKGFMEKLELYDKSSFYETIFIDADCLIFKDISNYFRYFSETGCDFTCFGTNLIIKNYTEKGMFDAGKTRHLDITHIPNFNAVIYYFKKTVMGKRVFDYAIELSKEKNDYGYVFFGDEPLIALSMAVNKCYCQDKYYGERFVFVPRARKVKTNFKKKHLSRGYGYKIRKVLGEKKHKLTKEEKADKKINGKNRHNACILHFGTTNTFKPFYKQLAGQIRNIDNIKYYFYKSKVIYGVWLSVHKIKCFCKDTKRFTKRCFSYIKRRCLIKQGER